jgi:hypothetical protein
MISFGTVSLVCPDELIEHADNRQCDKCSEQYNLDLFSGQHSRATVHRSSRHEKVQPELLDLGSTCNYLIGRFYTFHTIDAQV